MGVARLALARGPQGFSKLVVLKQLHPHLARDEDSVRMFLEEARICARLAHANVVQVYEITAHQEAPTIVMEYLEGLSLASLLSLPERLPLPAHLSILAGALRGLHAAHELTDYDGTPLGIVHRDVSPHNLFVCYSGEAKVLDFGVAKIAGSEAHTRTGVLKGKLRYMAPEQVAGETLDRGADLFAVGVLLWEALSGRRMWQGQSDGRVLQALLQGALPPVPESASSELSSLCRCALAVRPENRFASALEFAEGIEAHLAKLTANPKDTLIRFLEVQCDEQRRERQATVAARIRRASSRPPPSAKTVAGVIHHGRARSPARAVGGRALAAGALLVLCSSAGAALVWKLEAPSDPEPSARLAGAAVDCPPPGKVCAGQCVSRDDPEYGCGRDDCAPCQLAHATLRCSQEGKCAIAICHKGHGDCDGDPSNGCEVHVATDPRHCGACQAPCQSLPHAQAGCGLRCGIWRCEPGYEDCNGVVEDGCEVALLTSPEHCGACAHACPSGQACREGSCSR